MHDYRFYAGRWVALDEDHSVVGVGNTPEEAHASGRYARPKARLQVARIASDAPFLALPQWPLETLRQLAIETQLWLVGGAVRDLLLQRPVHDWDFAVDGRATTLARDVADKLGGAFVLLDSEHDTARAIVHDPTNHRPVALDFAGLRGATLEEDLFGRDFTLNAIASTLDGKVLDPTDGQSDLAEHRIRATTARSFEQDPARLLRAVRTAAELGFQIEAQTLELMRQSTPSIRTVAAERVRAEYLRIMQAEPATASLRQAETLGLLAETLPEIAVLREVHQSPPHQYANALDHTFGVIAAMKMLQTHLRGFAPSPAHRQEVRAPRWAWDSLSRILLPYQKALLDYLAQPVTFESDRADLLFWGALFHDAGKAQTRSVDDAGTTHFYGHDENSAEAVRTRFSALRFPTKAQNFVITLVEAHMRLTLLSDSRIVTRRAIYRFFRDTGEAGVGVVLLSLSDILAVFGPELEPDRWQRTLRATSMLLAAAFTHREVVVTPPPLLNGHDLIAMGMHPGPHLGKLLEEIREAQAAGEVTTREQAEALVHATLSDQRKRSKA